MVPSSRHAARSRESLRPPAGSAPGLSSGAGRLISVVRPLRSWQMRRSMLACMAIIARTASAESGSQKAEPEVLVPVVIRCEDYTGGGLPGCRVELESADQQLVSTTGATGASRLAVPPNSVWRLKIELDGFLPSRPDEIFIGTEAVELRQELAFDTSKEIIIACPIPFWELDPFSRTVERWNVEELPRRRSLDDFLNLVPGVNAKSGARK